MTLTLAVRTCWMTSLTANPKMIGIDTSFLVAWAIPEHPDHSVCRALALQATSAGRTFGITHGILAEFVHVATDPRRFAQPLTIGVATHFAEFWSQAAEVRLLRQDQAVSQQWLAWMTQHHLGRKRLLDTLIAATWHCSGITAIYTLNPADFKIFNLFSSLP